MSTLPCLYPEGRPAGKKLFFVSDLHLGILDLRESRMREQLFVRWLKEVAPQAAALYLLGDLWDFWFEYRRCVPKGSVRLLGTLAELCDAGLPIYFMPGNHDQWLTGYLSEEVGLRQLPDPYMATHCGRRILLSHGHRLGPLSWSERLANWIMEQPFLQRLYRGLLHPDLGLLVGRFLSGRSRKAHHPLDFIDLGEREYLYRYVRDAVARGEACDWYIFAHRHYPAVRQVGPAIYVVLGEWIIRRTYLEVEREKWGLWQIDENGVHRCLFSGSFTDVVVGV